MGFDRNRETRKAAFQMAALLVYCTLPLCAPGRRTRVEAQGYSRAGATLGGKGHGVCRRVFNKRTDEAKVGLMLDRLQCGCERCFLCLAWIELGRARQFRAGRFFPRHAGQVQRRSSAGPGEAVLKKSVVMECARGSCRSFSRLLRVDELVGDSKAANLDYAQALRRPDVDALHSPRPVNSLRLHCSQ